MVLRLPESMTNAETLENLLKQASKAPPGDFAEIGVGRGGTSYFLYQIAEEQGRKLHLFDSGLDEIEKWCLKAIMHEGRFPDTWKDMNNIAFCFYDIAYIEGAKFLIERISTDFVKNGIALFYPFNRSAIDYNRYPDWTIGGRGNMRYPFIERRD